MHAVDVLAGLGGRGHELGLLLEDAEVEAAVEVTVAHVARVDEVDPAVGERFDDGPQFVVQVGVRGQFLGRDGDDALFEQALSTGDLGRKFHVVHKGPVELVVDGVLVAACFGQKAGDATLALGEVGVAHLDGLGLETGDGVRAGVRTDAGGGWHGGFRWHGWTCLRG